MADDFDPAAFDAFKKAQASPPAVEPAAVPAPPISGFDPAAFEAVKKSLPAPAPTSWLDTAKEGAKGLIRGVGNFAGDMGEAVMGPFGPSHHFGNLMHDIGYGEKPPETPSYGHQIAKAVGVDSEKPGYAGSIGEVVGNPASYFGPGGWLAKTFMGAASGAGGQAAADATEGTGWEGPARVAGSLAAGPLAARALKPQLGPQQQALADAGVTQMTPGQLTGGILKNLEDKASSIPLLGTFINNARGRSVESFNRAVANQALEPIGQRVAARTEAGHPMIAEVEHHLDTAYNNLLPRLNFIPDRQYGLDLDHIHQQQVRLLPQPQIDQFERILDAKLGPPAPMHGRTLKNIESELTNLSRNYGSSADAAQRGLGHALGDVVTAIRSNLERSNPADAERLRNINLGWAMYARMRTAAANRIGNEGVFGPGDLLSAVKRGDKSVGKGAFARGDALMQDFAEAGNAVLPNKVPNSGTADRAMAAGLVGGGSYLLEKPEIVAAAAAAAAPYTRPSMALLNRYVRPTEGARANYAAAGRGAGMLRPFTQQNPFDNLPNPFAP